MESLMRFLFAALMMILLLSGSERSARAILSRTTAPPTQVTKLEGRWKVKFILSGVEKNLVFDAKAKGIGSFQLLDTGSDDKPVPTPLPGAWAELTNDRVSFSSEAELPIGTCCREIGTIIFKGRFISSNTIAGKLIFVTSVDEEESPYKFRSAIGTFTASRVLN